GAPWPPPACDCPAGRRGPHGRRGRPWPFKDYRRSLTMPFMLFSIITNATWAAVRHLWEHVDRTGWDGACLSDHFMPNTPARSGETLECWTTLASLATVVPRMRIGTLVAGN